MEEIVLFIHQLDALIKQASAFVDICCDVIGAFRDAPAEILAIRNEVANFQFDLRTLKSFVQVTPDPEMYLESLTVKFESLQIATEVIDKLSDKVGTGSSKLLLLGRQDRISWVERLTYVFKAKDVSELLNKLRACRDTIAFSLAAESVRDIQEVKKAVKTGHEEITNTQTQIMKSQAEIKSDLSDHRKGEIIRWFKVDERIMRGMHEDRRCQQEKDTCQWFEREEAWKDWLICSKESHGSCKFIWVHGIAGAGKTVLASYLIEKAVEHCRPQGLAYYYCHHSRNHDETKPFLRHVVKTLVAHSHHVPKKMVTCYTSDTQLSIVDLLECLEELSSHFKGGVRIIIDAVDESAQPRDKLIEILMKIGTQPRFRNVSLLMTSREEQDIKNAVESCGPSCESIDMFNAGAKEDIRQVVHKELGKKHWDAAFSRDIEDKLVNQSRGMFRWVACQLTLLNQRTHAGSLQASDMQQIRQLMQNLPTTIFATYERILLGIPEDDKPFARTALALISGRGDSIPTAEVLVQSCLYNVQFGQIANYDINALERICGCLIKVTPLHVAPPSVLRREEETTHSKVSLAHYTVKEFLLHPETLKGNASFFALTDKVLDIIDLTVTFNGLRHIGAAGFRPRPQKAARLTLYEEYCLIRTGRALENRRNTILKDEELSELVLQSLDYTSPHATHLRSVRMVARKFSKWDKLVSLLEAPCGAEVSSQVHILLSLVQLEWFDMARHYLDNHASVKTLGPRLKDKLWTTTFKCASRGEDPGDHEAETLLMHCVRKQKIHFLKLFMRHGAFFDLESEVLYAIMYNPYDEQRRPIVLTLLRLLLDAGSGTKPNPTPLLPGSDQPRRGARGRFAFTPLQVAVAHLEEDWVDALLVAGAHPDAVGGPPPEYPNANGHIPHCYTRAVPSGLGSAVLCEMGRLTPLQVARVTSPPWDTDDKVALVKEKRKRIERMLRQWGAEDVGQVDSDQDAVMGEDEEVVDLTRSGPD